MEVNAGIKNIFNSFQNDFDKGIDRDPGYVYGPTSPRTIYFGVKFGSFQ
jgi:outer membrane receptor for ferrienterochelin and colicins